MKIGLVGRTKWVTPLLALTIAFGLAGCGGGEGVEDSKGKVKLVVWSDPFRVEGFKSYEAKHPEVDLEIVEISNPKDLTAKLQMAGRAGSGGPDVVWTPLPQLAPAFDQKPYEFAADLTDKVPADLVDGFAAGAMDTCRHDGRLVCLRNDIAPTVLWYAPALMKKFGYSVPRTWEEYEQLGLRLAKEHPGYSVGTAGDPWSALIYFWSSRCPVIRVDGRDLASALTGPECGRVAAMMDRLIAAGSMSKSKATDPEYIKDVGKPGKILMSPGPIWYGLNLFHDQFANPPGTYAISAPLAWSGEPQSWTGNVGGGAYVVSRHSEHEKAAVDLVTWMATGEFQEAATTVTLPAFAKHQDGWIARQSAAKVFSNSPAEAKVVIDEAVKNLWPDFGLIDLPAADYIATVPAGLAAGKTVTEMLPVWAKTIEQQAKAAGWDVR